MITVALIDDHLIVRSGFAQLLGLEPDLQVVAEFGSGREALAGLPGRGVQVCICDISMPDISGLELLSQLPKGMATIMLSVHDSPALVEQALNAGARGFLSKRCSPDELIAAVHTVATGGCYLTPDIAIKLASGRQDPLTKRERQVAEKLAQGMAVKEIAAELERIFNVRIKIEDDDIEKYRYHISFVNHEVLPDMLDAINNDKKLIITYNKDTIEIRKRR